MKMFRKKSGKQPTPITNVDTSSNAATHVVITDAAGNKKRKMIISGIIVLVVIGLGGVLFAVRQDSSSPTITDTEILPDGTDVVPETATSDATGSIEVFAEPPAESNQPKPTAAAAIPTDETP